MLSWLKRLFTHTAETPPASPPRHPPAGLDRPDPEEIVGFASGVDAGESKLEPPKPVFRTTSAPPEQDASRFGVSVDDDVYGLTFTIEYRAANGEFSRRRIMLRTISQQADGRTYLQSYDFERKALRTFRLDRVTCVIDGDGQVFDNPAAFLRDELKVRFNYVPAVTAPTRVEVPVTLEEAPLSGRTTSSGASGNPPTRPRAAAELPMAQPVKTEPPGHAQRRCARDGLRVLVALARSDGELHAAETEVVLDYVGDMCQRHAVPYSDDDRNALRGYVRRQRLGMEVLERCLEQLDATTVDEKQSLLAFADRLIDADGHLHEDEHQAIGEIRHALSLQ